METTSSSVAGHPPTGAAEAGAPALGELEHELERSLEPGGSVPAGVAAAIRARTGWHGRLLDVLALLTETRQRIGYLAGGDRPEEVITWLSVWADSPLSLEEMELVFRCGGWDPEPFSVLAAEGLLRPLLICPDGSLRRVRGELAGAWVSDELALTGDEELLAATRQVIESDRAPSSGAG